MNGYNSPFDDVDDAPAASLEQIFGEDAVEAARAAYDDAFVEKLVSMLRRRKIEVVDPEGLATALRHRMLWRVVPPPPMVRDLKAFRDRAWKANRHALALGALLDEFDPTELELLERLRVDAGHDALRPWRFSEILSSFGTIREALAAGAEHELRRGRARDLSFRGEVAFLADLYARATGKEPTRSVDAYAGDDPEREPENSPFYAFLRAVLARHPDFRGRPFEATARDVLKERRERMER